MVTAAIGAAGEDIIHTTVDIIRIRSTAMGMDTDGRMDTMDIMDIGGSNKYVCSSKKMPVLFLRS